MPRAHGLPALSGSFLGTRSDTGLDEFRFWALLMPGVFATNTNLADVTELQLDIAFCYHSLGGFTCVQVLALHAAV